ncbi:hypothetical protein OROGR_019700 [Orobanche gracilis]
MIKSREEFNKRTSKPKKVSVFSKQEARDGLDDDSIILLLVYD